MEISPHQSVAIVRAKLMERQGDLAKATKEELKSGFEKTDYVSISNEPKYDESDYKRVLDKFRQTDANIKAHEQIHAAKSNTISPISYNYQTGPDGKLYAVGGHVRLDTSIPDDHKAAAFKLDQIKNAASGPADLSGADLQIARTASLNKMLLEIRGENHAS